jgi:ABC-type phosphonate transport system ATPase subunit
MTKDILEKATLLKCVIDDLRGDIGDLQHAMEHAPNMVRIAVSGKSKDVLTQTEAALVLLRWREGLEKLEEEFDKL